MCTALHDAASCGARSCDESADTSETAAVSCCCSVSSDSGLRFPNRPLRAIGGSKRCHEQCPDGGLDVTGDVRPGRNHEFEGVAFRLAKQYDKTFCLVVGSHW